jgi:2-polyprenyl-3-methyl-5-hydroxy-6-metoxy-1,4-benzoquinol methylase
MRGGLTVHDHDRELALKFDAEAPKFEVAPVQSDPVAIARLVGEAGFPPDALVLDAGCGPGLVSAGLLESGSRVVGVDLSGEMIERARRRCAAAGGRARFLQISVFDSALDRFGLFDGALSRYVLHHVLDPAAFLARQVGLVRSGGVLVGSDHVTDPDPQIAAHHGRLEVARDRTHTRNLTGGQLVDLFAAAGLTDIRLLEVSFAQDFDEWFDRGTPGDTREHVRQNLLSGPVIRSFRPLVLADGSIRIDGVQAIVRGTKP